jgi:RNA polymerase sigma factor (sigma-70 family)
MNERREDFELLQKFVRQGQQAAFTTVVRRHLDLVYGTAYRKVENQGAAEEVTQNVFAALARKAWRFAPDDSLPAWLHRTALLEAKAWLRGELRRRRREQTAAELGTTMKTPDEQPAMRALVPLLDEALLSLREQDRTALLLRYYESQSLREVGAALGVGEDAAQKRVAGAIEKLTGFFRRRGFKTATSAVAVAALQHTTIAAPAIVAASVAQTVTQIGPPALTGLTSVLSRLTTLTRLKTVSLCALLAAGPVAWQWNQFQAVRKSDASLRLQLETSRVQQEQVSAEIERLRAESSRFDGALEAAAQAQGRNEEAARRLEVAKARMQAMLTDANYRWPEDSPYVRVPKSVVRKLDLHAKFWAGTISEQALELYGINAAEKAPAEKALGDYWSGTLSLMASHAYETNAPSAGRSHPERVTKTVIVPPLGKELTTLADTTRGQLTDALGAERENLLFGGWDQGAIQIFWPGNLWRIAEEPQTCTVWADPTATQEPFLGTSWNSTLGGTSSDGSRSLKDLPVPIVTRFFQPWLQQLGITNSIHE